MKSGDLIEQIKDYKTLSIIGTDKNVGKTTVLNYIIEKTRGEKTLGLTSIGRDGEEIDAVTNTNKPKIYIERGTLVATAKQCLFNSDITREIVKTTSINTPMGEIIISKALSNGYIELGGPSTNKLIAKMCNEMQKLGSDMVLVDGALSRKSLASPSITEGTILSTGASLGKSIDKVIEKTNYIIKNLCTEAIKDNEILNLSYGILETSRVGIINKDRSVKLLNVVTALECSKELIENIDEESEYIIIKGILSGRIIEDLMKCCKYFKKLTFVVYDGTKIFLSETIYEKFIKLGGKLRVIYPINLCCITCNPISPYGYEFDSKKFVEKMQNNTELPVFDVVGGN